MDIYEQQQQHQRDDLISLNIPTTTLSGRSTPNTNNRSNKTQQPLTIIDDYLFENDLYLFNKQQQKQHQQQLQLLNNEIQNRLMFSNNISTLNDHHHHQPPPSSSSLTNSYRSLSLNNVLLQQQQQQQSPTRQTNNNNNNNLIDSFIFRQSLQTPPPQPNNTNRRERSLDRSNSSSLLTSINGGGGSGGAKQRSYSVNKTSNDLFRNDLSINSFQKLLQQQQQQQQGPSNKTNKELQIKIIEMQKEIISLKCELELTTQKLQSSIQSIKTFWSPELKKERLSRKEESSKYQSLLEKYKIMVVSTSSSSNNGVESSININEDQQQSTILNLNKLIKENSLLKKTISELELRINTQKQVVTSKDETIKNLFMLINSKDSQHQQQHQHEISNNFELNELKVRSFIFL